MLHAIKIYGRGECPQTLRAVETVRSMGMRFDYFDLDRDRHAAAWVRWKLGELRTPVVMVGMQVLANPTPAELSAAVGARAA